MPPGQQINHKCHLLLGQPHLAAQTPLAHRQARHLVASASQPLGRQDSPPPTLARWGSRSQPLRPSQGFHQRPARLMRPASQDHSLRQPRLEGSHQHPAHLPCPASQDHNHCHPARLLSLQRQARFHRLISLGHRLAQERQARFHRQGQVVLWAVLLNQECQARFRQEGRGVLWVALRSRGCQARFRSNPASRGNQWERQASHLGWEVPQRHRPKKGGLDD
jgi:hypothetical protein